MRVLTGNGGQRVLEWGSIMALNLYRRHRADCTGRHPEDAKSSELEERSKNLEAV